MLHIIYLNMDSSSPPPKGFPGGASAHAGDAGDMGSTLCWEDPLEEGMETHSSILA